MTNKIEKFDILAQSTIASVGNAKASRQENANNQNRLSFLVLNILASGNVKEISHITATFQKDGGKFFSLRMVLSRAKTVLKELNTNGKVTIKTKKETLCFDKAIVTGWNIEEEIPFNVSSAYNTIKANEEKTEIPVKSENDLALEFYAQTLGMALKEVKSNVEIGAFDMADILAQYRTYEDDQAKAQALQDVPAMAETIRAQFLALQGLDAKTAENLLLSLVGQENEAMAA